MAERTQKIELRRNRILQTLRREGVVSVSRLSTDLGATPVTIRSDLAALEQEGYLLRVQGGAVPIRETGTGSPSGEPVAYAEENTPLPRRSPPGSMTGTPFSSTAAPPASVSPKP